MKALERRRKKQLELEKRLTESSNDMQKNKLTPIPSNRSKRLITNEDIVKNQSSSTLKQGNNVDEEKMQRIKERRERRRKKNQTNEKEPSYANNDMNANANENDNINVPEIQKNNDNSIKSEKKLNTNRDNNNNIEKIISENNSVYSINNNVENNTSLSNQNYKFLSKNYNEIKLENIKEFLNKTNAEKPSNEQKEYEIKNMIKIMELKPKEFNIKTNKEEESIFTANILKKIEGNEEYEENKKEIKKLKNRIKDEENKIEKTLEKNKEEIKKYIENIIKLQNNLINSSKGDIFYLEEENKIDEIKIQNLRATHRRLIEENKQEKDRISKIINEQIPIYAKELEKEIEEVKKMKHQLEILGKKKPPNDILKKIEVVMRYMKKK